MGVVYTHYIQPPTPCLTVDLHHFDGICFETVPTFEDIPGLSMFKNLYTAAPEMAYQEPADLRRSRGTPIY